MGVIRRQSLKHSAVNLVGLVIGAGSTLFVYPHALEAYGLMQVLMAVGMIGLPLLSLESHRPVKKFDVVGVSLQYELCYTNVLQNLDLGGIPLRSRDRGESDPIVIAGGPTATHPEPLTPFVDLCLVGEAEEVLPGLLRTIGSLRRAGHCPIASDFRTNSEQASHYLDLSIWAASWAASSRSIASTSMPTARPNAL